MLDTGLEYTTLLGNGFMAFLLKPLGRLLKDPSSNMYSWAGSMVQ